MDMSRSGMNVTRDEATIATSLLNVVTVPSRFRALLSMVISVRLSLCFSRVTRQFEYIVASIRISDALTNVRTWVKLGILIAGALVGSSCAYVATAVASDLHDTSSAKLVVRGTTADEDVYISVWARRYVTCYVG